MWQMRLTDQWTGDNLKDTKRGQWMKVYEEPGITTSLFIQIWNRKSIFKSLPWHLPWLVFTNKLVRTEGGWRVEFCKSWTTGGKSLERSDSSCRCLYRKLTPEQDKLVRSVRATMLRTAAFHMIDAVALSSKLFSLECFIYMKWWGGLAVWTLLLVALKTSSKHRSMAQWWRVAQQFTSITRKRGNPRQGKHGETRPTV